MQFGALVRPAVDNACISDFFPPSSEQKNLLLSNHTVKNLTQLIVDDKIVLMMLMTSHFLMWLKSLCSWAKARQSTVVQYPSQELCNNLMYAVGLFFYSVDLINRPFFNTYGHKHIDHIQSNMWCTNTHAQMHAYYRACVALVHVCECSASHVNSNHTWVI